MVEQAVIKGMLLGALTGENRGQLLFDAVFDGGGAVGEVQSGDEARDLVVAGQRRQGLTARHDGDRFGGFHRALAAGVEQAYALDFVPNKFQPCGKGSVGRVDVHNATSQAEGTGHLHAILTAIPQPHPLGQHVTQSYPLSDGQGVVGPPKGLRGNGLPQGPHCRGDNHEVGAMVRVHGGECG